MTDTNILSISRLVSKIQTKKVLKKIQNVDKKIPNDRELVKKADYDTKVEEIKTKYLVLLV